MTFRRERLWEALDVVLGNSHRMPADSVPDAIADVLRSVDGEAVMFAVDLHQEALTPLCAGEEVIDIDGSIGGRAYRAGTVQRTQHGADHVWWFPLLDGADRHGVVRITTPFDPSELESTLASVATIAAELLVTKSFVGDALTVARRREELSVAAEIRWATLPPLSFVSEAVEICGALEPAYDIAGDTFDYAVNGAITHAAIFDAVGHGLEASRLASLAVVSYRHSRRQQLTLLETFAAMDGAVQDQFGEQDFVTAQLLELDTRTGNLSILNAGHPPPLLLRRGRVVGEINCKRCQPVGLGDSTAEVTTIALEPEDRIILYTDGITEARSASGEYFGVQRLTQHVANAAASGESSPETIRRLIHSVLAHEAGRLRDDASVIVIAWTARTSD